MNPPIPGPWSYRKGPLDWHIDGPIDSGILSLAVAVDEGDARLIAAAPALLDAARFAFAAMNSEDGRKKAEQVLVNAIASAAER